MLNLRVRAHILRKWLIIGLSAALFVLMGAVHAAPPTTELAILHQIYNNNNGANWVRSANWMNDQDPCDPDAPWAGISCDAERQHVIGVDLSSNNLTGLLPDLTPLARLAIFNVQRNGLTGPIPSLNGLTALKYFNASYNTFVGDIPAFSELIQLRTYDASNNNLTGVIPSLDELVNLSSFSVQYNKLTGSIPSLSGLQYLSGFSAHNNQLTGSIPPLSGLTMLAGFHVSHNKLTGEIPSLSGLVQLRYFDIVSNQIAGSIPSLTGLSSLGGFFVAGNRLSGSIPPLSELTTLWSFYASGNQLTGQIPSLSGLVNLWGFEVSHNQLTGEIPSLNGLISLKDFNVTDNKLTGPIPDLTGLTALETFFVGGNQLIGSIPPAPPSVRMAYFCPNRLVPAEDPPNANDLSWSNVVSSTPWSAGCTFAANAHAINGTVVPAAQMGGFGATPSFVVTPATGFTVLPIVEGSCPSGTWDGNTYTVGALISNCAVSFSFASLTTVVDGSCGTANGVAVVTAPSVNLCSAGTASAVNGSGPWAWNCDGQNGGEISQCSAPMQSIVRGEVTAVPTMSNLSLALLALLASGFGARHMRRRT